MGNVEVRYKIEIHGGNNIVPLVVPDFRLKQTVDSFLAKGFKVLIVEVMNEQ